MGARLKLSIVTPVLNDKRVARALDSLLAQQCEHELELIVVDGGSTDGTLEILDSYREHISVLVSEPDNGIFDGMNKGIGLATGEVVAILNADDRYYDEFVLRDVMTAFTDVSVDVCYGAVVQMNSVGKPYRFYHTEPGGRWRWRLGWMPPHPAFFVRRRLYKEFGTFDLRYRVAADYELMLRLLFVHRIRTRFLPGALVDMAPKGFSNRADTVPVAAFEVARAWRDHGLGWFSGLVAAALKLARRPRQFFMPRRAVRLADSERRRRWGGEDATVLR